MKKRIPELIIIFLLIAIVGLLSYMFFFKKDDPLVKLQNDDSVSRTIMIYMVGSNLESDYAIATSDLNEIEPSNIDLDNVTIYLYTGGTLKWHNFVSNQENAIYKLTEDGFKKEKTYKRLNMGSADTLASFLNYGYENSKSDEYDLIIYDHGGAIDGAVYDDFSNDNLSLADFDDALNKSPFDQKNKLEFVLFRTCLNGTLEVANVFAPYAKYMIASEEITNGARGTSVLSFLNDVDASDNAIEIGKSYIANYNDVINQIDPTGITVDPMYSIIDLSSVNEFTKEFNNFIESIDLDTHYGSIIRLRSALFQYGYSFYGENDYDMVDVYTLITGLSYFTDYDTTKLYELYDDTVVYNKSSLNDSHGLSIYFPYRGSQTSMFFRVYRNLGFNKKYLEFIQTVQKKSSSKQESSFMSLDEATQNGREFSLELTPDQQKDFAEAIYIIFKKDSEGYYMPIYSSDNMKEENGVLKTQIENNLVKITKEDGTTGYITMIERNKSDQHVLNTTASIFGYQDGNHIGAAVNVYFTVKNGVPKIIQYINITDGVIIDINDYDRIDFVNTRYNIVDENGNYLPEWERAENLDYIEVFTDENYKLSLASLGDGDYYCVFKIVDVYGNEFYSKLSSIK